MARVAVPIFFIIAGYFAFYAQPNLDKCRKKIWGALQKLLLAYAIYIIFDLFLRSYHHQNWSDYLESLIYQDFIRNFGFYNYTVTSGFHLWFLVALFLIYLVHYYAERWQFTRYYVRIFAPLLLLSIFLNAFLPILHLGQLQIAFTRNAIFIGLPFFMIGYLMHQYAEQINRLNHWWYLIIGLIFMFLPILEAKYIFGLEAELYLSNVICSICLAWFFISLPKVNPSCGVYCVLGTEIYLYIYIFHLAVQKLFNQVLHWQFQYMGIMVFLFTFAVVLVGRWVLLGMKWCIKRLAHRECLDKLTESN